MTHSVAPKVIGIDVGGANLKYASIDCFADDGLGNSGPDDRERAERKAYARFFPMWKQHRDLAATIEEDLRSIFEADARTRLAITMTGELADCFRDREAGVSFIVSAVCEAADALGITTPSFYGVDGKFHGAKSAAQQCDVVAAANWHALASFVGTVIAPNALLVDIGSTTTDIIPIRNGATATDACTDFDRLREGSLVYVGGRRTPACAIVDSVPHRGHLVPVMNEFFATIDDARIVLGHQPEDVEDTDSADGSGRSVLLASNRLARMIGLDHRHFSAADARETASHLHAQAVARIGSALHLMAESHPVIDQMVVSGHAADLISETAGLPTIRLADRLGMERSRCAPSYAVAWLWSRANIERELACDAS